MTPLEVTAPFLGAVAMEVVHWYQLREKLDTAKYQRLLRSTGYWVATVLMVVVGGLSTLVLFGDKLGQAQLLLAGAAFPSLIHKLVASFISRHTTKLGPEHVDEGTPVRDYFAT